jgi:DNA segregation ATPase FtsK/SpoIIIE, S-DNA-T family
MRRFIAGQLNSSIPVGVTDMADTVKPSPRSLLLPFCALVVCLFLWPAMLTFSAGDWPSPNQFPHNSPTKNLCGVVGAWASYQLRYFLGDGTYPLLLFGTLASLLRLVRGEIGNGWERAFGLVLLVACTSASTHLISGPGAGPMPVGSGGLIGYGLGELLRDHMDRLGTLIVLAAGFFVGLLFTTEGWVLKIPSLIGRAAQATGTAARVAQARAGGAGSLGQFGRAVLLGKTGGSSVGDSITQQESDALLGPRGGSTQSRSGKASNEAVRGKSGGSGKTLFDSEEDLFDSEFDDKKPVVERVPVGHQLHEQQSESASEVSTSADAARREGRGSSRSPAGQQPHAPEAKESRAARVPIVNFPSPRQTARAESYPRQIENWTLPPLTLLQEPEYGFTKQQEQVVREQARVLERTLEEFRVEAQVVEIDTGPVITMFELKLGAGVKVSQIASLSNDIARALKAHAIRVVAPISGKNTIGIEVPNLQKEKVRLKELITIAGKRASEMGLPLFLGKDASGAALVADLTKMPHLLIAGTTGSGKSVCLNTIIVSLLMTKRPDHVKMILIDPKMVEMSQFKGVPHLMCPIVTDVQRAEKILAWAVTKMDERYEVLAEAGVRNIAGYNALSSDELFRRFAPENEAEKSRISLRLPYIVVIIDELADLMMTSGKEVEHHLSRLAQKSRAVGIHIIVATQRPEVKVVTGLVKSNLPSRICFRVASRMDSRIVLDQNGGEVLLGQGDMLFLPPGQHKLLRAQGTFLEDAEVHAVLQDLAARAEPEFHPELVKIQTTGGEDDEGMRDPLFDDAVRVVLQSKRGSVSLLQRRLTVGYSRASRLIEQMSAAGIVGDYKGSQAREVLITLDEWEAMREQYERELAENYEADQDDHHDHDEDDVFASSRSE